MPCLSPNHERAGPTTALLASLTSVAISLMGSFVFADLSPAPGEVLLELNMVDETMIAYANNAPCNNDILCGALEVKLESPLAKLNTRSLPNLGLVFPLIAGSTNTEYIERTIFFTILDGSYDLSALYNFSAGVDAELSFQFQDIDGSTTAETLIINSLCDFTKDSQCDVADLNLMFSKGNLVTGVSVTEGDSFDLNGDHFVNQADIETWLEVSAKKAGYGSPFRRGDTDDLGAIFPARRDVDITDFNALAGNFDPSGSNASTNTWDRGNFDGDDDVDITDFNALANHFTPSGYSARIIPEPNAVFLLTFALLAYLARRPERSAFQRLYFSLKPRD